QQPPAVAGGATNVDWVDRSGFDRNLDFIRTRATARDFANIEGPPAPGPRHIATKRVGGLTISASPLTYVRAESVPIESFFHLLHACGGPDDRPEANVGIALDRDARDRRPDAVRLGADGFLDLAIDQRRLEQFPHGRHRQ